MSRDARQWISGVGRAIDPRTGYRVGEVDITASLKVGALLVLLAVEAVCLLAIADVVHLPRPTALLLMVSIIGAWVLAAAPKPRDPNGAWQPRSKLSVMLVIAGIVGSLVFACGSALIAYRSIDGCRDNKPSWKATNITRSFNVLTGSVRCQYGQESREEALVRHIPFGDLL